MIKNVSLCILQVVFEAIRGKGYRGDMAIDDTSLTDGGCQQYPSNAMPSQSKLLL